MSGVVYVNGQRADKPGAQVAPDAKIEVRGNTLPYVSRGGFKLEKALRVFRSILPASHVLTAVPRPADLRMCCCKTARQRSTPSMSATASWRGACATIRA